MPLHPSDYAELAYFSRSSVFEAFVEAWQDSRSLGRDPEEVDYVYFLASYGTRSLAKRWTPILKRRGIQLRLTGVFCHKTPMATYGGSKCELGDLLIVHDRLGASPQRKACLFQAKVTQNGVPTALDPIQEALYRHWPDFSLAGGTLKGRSFAKGLRNLRQHPDFARFGLVGKDAPWWPRKAPRPSIYRGWIQEPWVVSDPRGPISVAGSEGFGSFLAGMLYDTIPSRGEVVIPPTTPAPVLGAGDDLHITVDEMLAVTANRTLKSKAKPANRKSYVGSDRGTTALAFQQASQNFPTLGAGMRFASAIAAGGGEDGPEPPADEDPDDEGGLSILLIETFDEDR